MGGTQQASTSPNAEKTPFRATRFACSVMPSVISSVRPFPFLSPMSKNIKEGLPPATQCYLRSALVGGRLTKRRERNSPSLRLMGTPLAGPLEPKG
mmetsp:Transcript_53096/g.84473  ORF Transcript_53096/g.84473 Transcript_53096/m.84473 type:complete len:96 (-) Transcript_53096:9-296(-)